MLRLSSQALGFSLAFFAILSVIRRISAGTSAPISTDEITQFMKNINTARELVLPSAAKMPCLIWSPRLASLAQAKANACNTSSQASNETLHFNKLRLILSDIFTKWNNEAFDYFSEACFDTTNHTCANVKTLNNDQNTEVGCATSECGEGASGYLTVCNFNGFLRPEVKPFVIGKSCSNCQSPRTNCVKNLCCF